MEFEPLTLKFGTLRLCKSADRAPQQRGDHRLSYRRDEISFGALHEDFISKGPS